MIMRERRGLFRFHCVQNAAVSPPASVLAGACRPDVSRGNTVGAVRKISSTRRAHPSARVTARVIGCNQFN